MSSLKSIFVSLYLVFLGVAFAYAATRIAGPHWSIGWLGVALTTAPFLALLSWLMLTRKAARTSPRLPSIIAFAVTGLPSHSGRARSVRRTSRPSSSPASALAHSWPMRSGIPILDPGAAPALLLARPFPPSASRTPADKSSVLTNGAAGRPFSCSFAAIGARCVWLRSTSLPRSIVK